MTDQIQITKTKPAQSTSSDLTFPTEILELPSKGLVYPSDNPLSSGKIEIKMMSAKEEDILTNPNLLKKGIAVDKMLESLIVDKSINFDDIVVGDRNALIFAVRRLAYGDTYGPLDIKCPACNSQNKITIDISQFDDKVISEDVDKVDVNEFVYKLPFAKLEITFKLLNGLDERNIQIEIDKMKKVKSADLSTRLKYMILSVQGNRDISAIRDFVDNRMVSRDTLAFRKYLKQISPDIDATFPFECEECSHEERSGVPMTVHFFWPDAIV